MKSETIELLAAALVKAQGEFPTVTKDSENPFFKSKYADLATVTKAAQPVLTKNGLAVTQFVSHDGNGGSLLKTYLLHESGQYICDEMPLLMPKGTPQDQGSAITYAKRYSYMAVLGLVADEDDDGNKASKPGTEYHKPSKPELIQPAKMAELKKLLTDAGLTGDMAVQFVQEKLGKSKPESNEDADKLIAILKKEPF